MLRKNFKGRRKARMVAATTRQSYYKSLSRSEKLEQIRLRRGSSARERERLTR